MTCPTCGLENCTQLHMGPKIEVTSLHPEWTYDIKLSDDNTKGEKRVTIHVRSDGDPKKALELANQLFLGVFK